MKSTKSSLTVSHELCKSGLGEDPWISMPQPMRVLAKVNAESDGATCIRADYILSEVL